LDAELLLAASETAAGRFADALKTSEEIQKRYPKSVSGFLAQGNVLMAKRQYADAITAYEKGLKIDSNGLVMVKLHQALVANGKADEADRRLLQWLTGTPNAMGVRGYLATSYAEAGKNQQAIEQVRLLLETDPNNSWALSELALLYQKEKDPQALATAEKAYRLDADNAHVMDALAWILIDQGKPERALELLTKAREKAPASAEIRYHRAVALAKTGDVGRARRELEDLLSGGEPFRQKAEAQAFLKQLRN
jgi:tetratricopeptide (TPR) repeat protein